MRAISDDFLLNMAEVSASLIGLFLVGAFLYVESGRRSPHDARPVFEPYLRAGIRVTLIVFAIPLGLSLTLVALEPVWSKMLLAVLSLMLIAANLETALRIPSVWKVTHSTALLVMEVVTSIGVVVLVALPWILGGLHPTREEFTSSILIAFAAGFLAISATVMTAFDFARSGPDEPELNVRASEPAPASTDSDTNAAERAGSYENGHGTALGLGGSPPGPSVAENEPDE